MSFGRFRLAFVGRVWLNSMIKVLIHTHLLSKFEI